MTALDQVWQKPSSIIIIIYFFFDSDAALWFIA